MCAFFNETVYMSYALVVALMSHHEDFCHFKQVIGNYTAIGVHNIPCNGSDMHSHKLEGK